MSLTLAGVQPQILREGGPMRDRRVQGDSVSSSRSTGRPPAHQTNYRTPPGSSRSHIADSRDHLISRYYHTTLYVWGVSSKVKPASRSITYEAVVAPQPFGKWGLCAARLFPDGSGREMAARLTHPSSCRDSLECDEFQVVEVDDSRLDTVLGIGRICLLPLHFIVQFRVQHAAIPARCQASPRRRTSSSSPPH